MAADPSRRVETNRPAIVSVMGLVSIFCLASIFITPGFGDEINYHYPLARSISLKQIADPRSDYSSAYTPLPYLITHAFLRMFPSLHTARLLNFSVFFLSICFFYLLAKETTSEPWLLTLMMFLNPYALMSSFVFYLYNWGTLFALIGLYSYTVRRSWISAWIFFSLAVLSEQWMAVLPAAAMAHEILQVCDKKNTVASYAKRALVLLLIMAPALFIFANWRGLVHPNFASHALRPGFEHLTAVLSHLGFILFFPVIAGIRAFANKRYVPLLFALPLLWLSIPAFASYSDLEHITGFFPHLAMKIARNLFVPYPLTLFFFAIPGTLALAAIIKKTGDARTRLHAYAVIGFLVAFTASSRLATAHIYVALPFLILLFGREIAALRKLRILMALQYAAVGIALILYFIFFRSRGVLL